MSNIVVKVAVFESEKNWGCKLDDWMVCISIEEANTFKKEFNAENTEKVTPDFYMYADGDPQPIELTDAQMAILKVFKKVWLSVLKKTEPSEEELAFALLHFIKKNNKK